MIKSITIKRPDDWHLHLRDKAMMKAVLPYSSRDYGRAIIMPNLTPPLISTQQIIDYRDQILSLIDDDHDFVPLMTAYLSDQTDINDLILGYQKNIIRAVKLYPAHATTNSAHGVSSIQAVMPVLEAMQKQGIPLLIHGEVTDQSIDIFDREAQFIDTTLLPLMNALPELKIVLEHATTKEAAELVLAEEYQLAATITPQHILLNRNELFRGGLRPHNYCLPILKKETHRAFLMKAVTSGCSRFFLGTDSAPHEKSNKESSCGCAGAFNAPVALAIYAQVFEQANALDKLEAFTSLNGPDFYNLPVNLSTITLIKKAQTVADCIDVDQVGQLVPFLAGETIHWSVV